MNTVSDQDTPRKNVISCMVTRFNKWKRIMANVRGITSEGKESSRLDQEESRGVQVSKEQYGQLDNLLQYFQTGG